MRASVDNQFPVNGIWICGCPTALRISRGAEISLRGAKRRAVVSPAVNFSRLLPRLNSKRPKGARPEEQALYNLELDASKLLEHALRLRRCGQPKETLHLLESAKLVKRGQLSKIPNLLNEFRIWRRAAVHLASSSSVASL